MKDDAFTVNPPVSSGGRAGAHTSSPVLFFSSRTSASADGFFDLTRAWRVMVLGVAVAVRARPRR
jgi:hypothetical protein